MVAAVAIERNVLDHENDLESVAHIDEISLVESALAAENGSTANGSALVNVNATTKTVTGRRNEIVTDTLKEILVEIDIRKHTHIPLHLITCSHAVTTHPTYEKSSLIFFKSSTTLNSNFSLLITLLSQYSLNVH